MTYRGSTTIFDPAEAMAGDPAVQQAFLAAAFESDDPVIITKALGIVARSTAKPQIITFLGDDPPLTKLLHALKTLGLRLTVTEIKLPKGRP